MNCKELKEGIAGNLKGIRRSGDLEVLYRHSELLKRLGNDKVDGKDFERALILQKLFCNDLTEKQLHTLEVIMILSRLVDTFSSRILYPMLLLSGNHSSAAVLSWEEDLH